MLRTSVHPAVRQEDRKQDRKESRGGATPSGAAVAVLLLLRPPVFGHTAVDEIRFRADVSRSNGMLTSCPPQSHAFESACCSVFGDKNRTERVMCL